MTARRPVSDDGGVGGFVLRHWRACLLRAAWSWPSALPLLLLVATIQIVDRVPMATAEGPPSGTSAEADVEINKKGLGKEAIIRKGVHEWYMLVEVTPDNTVIVRQHKEAETYLVDESETHDRAFSPQEVEGAIDAFVSSAKTQAARQP